MKLNTLDFVILKKSKSMKSYKNRTTGKEITYFNIVGGRGDMIYHGRVYLRSKFDWIKEGMSVKFKNVVSKDKDAFWVTSSSTVSYCAVVETSVDPTTVILPEDEPPEGVKQPLQQAIRSPGKSAITGKVVKVNIFLKKVG